MGSFKRAKAAKKHRQSRKWLLETFAVVLIAALLGVAYTWYSSNSANSALSQPSPSPSLSSSPAPTASATSAFEAFTNHYLAIMESLNSTSTKALMAPLLNSSLNQTTLFGWEHGRMTFEQDSYFYEDPIQILSRGKGICVQWSIVYVAACLTLGYQSRLVVAADTSGWTFIHTWAEDYYNGTWVHVDPSDSVWNSPSRYQTWSWGQYLGSHVRVYAFEAGAFQDVTATYVTKSP